MSVTASRKSASPHKYFYSIFNVYFCLRETNAQRKAENRRDALAVRQRKNTVTNTTGSSTRWPGRLNGLDGRHVSVRRWACTVRCNPVCAVCVSSRHARTRHADIRRVCVWPNGLKLMMPKNGSASGSHARCAHAVHTLCIAKMAVDGSDAGSDHTWCHRQTDGQVKQLLSPDMHSRCVITACTVGVL